ncbi:MAG: hypothetical protein H7Z20_10715 [Bdellovibrio sp.]|nr:hypothetical protein [Methylotenera sp.]
MKVVALGKWDDCKNFETEYDRLKDAGTYNDVPYCTEQDNLLKSIPINDANDALFAKSLDENLAIFNRLMLLKVNREYYYVD